MSSASNKSALKIDFQQWEAQKEFPLFSLLTRVLIESLCPILKSEILFGDVEMGSSGEKFALWIDAKISGDFEGKVGVGADHHTLQVLAKHLNYLDNAGEPDEGKMLISLHEELAMALEKQFEQEDFRCTLSKGSGLLKDSFLTLPAGPCYVCPVDTAFGTLKVVFSLKANSPALISEIAATDRTNEPRKIRVYASQIENLFSNIKALEVLDNKSPSDTKAKGQVRAQIKKLKRMVHQMKCESLETLFLPARKLATEIAKSQGKQIRFATVGTWLYLDKTLLNNLYEPILHLVRNAVDHGIEDISVRERNGKSPVGTVKCLASFDKNGLKLLISDDGKGVDFDSVRERAVAKGLLTADVAQTKNHVDLAELLFQPGFSTREKADSISGRGLGLDIVRKGIESVDGTIRILSTSLHGTSFEIYVPLNDDFSLKKFNVPVIIHEPTEEDERTALLDELNHSLDRLTRALAAFEDGQNINAAYEAFRLAHSIKGITGFLGWSRVASFCHHYEELMKLIAEKNIIVDSSLGMVVAEAAVRLKEFCEATKMDHSYPLQEVRKLESRILQAIWGATHSEEKTQLFVGKYHLGALERFITPLSIGSSFSAKAESLFEKALIQPLGTLIQFTGDRRGFAGILLPEETFQSVIAPILTGHKNFNAKEKIGALSEFGKLMANEIVELAYKSGLSIQPYLPLTFHGLGNPLQVLGNPTYCYSCEVSGLPFYLAGDFRLPQELQQLGGAREISYHPALVVSEAKKRCEEFLSQAGVPVEFQANSTQSDLIGIDTGVSVMVTCRSQTDQMPDCVLFFTFDLMLAQALQKGQASEHLYDCLKEVGNIVAGSVVTELEGKRISLSLGLPTVFVGKAYAANFNRLPVATKLQGKTAKGRFELQVVVTHLE
jgi:CheY-specific phosphatase CheX/HPt (histidine-containing phosphotransfer) domain-containing protein